MGGYRVNVRITGGGARSPFWRQVQADIYGQKASTINAHEGPAFGVALLAAAGTGAYRDVVEACKATIETVDTTAPDAVSKKVYQSAYPLYGRLYAALKPEFSEIAGLVGQR